MFERNIPRFTKPMTNIEKAILEIEKNSKDIPDFKEKLGVYIQANPITNSTNLPELIKAIQGVTDIYDKSVGKLPKGGVQTLAKEAVHDQSLLNMTKLGEDIQSSIRNVMEQGIGNNLTRAEIRDNITNEIGSMSKTRAEVIARTESNNAYNQGRMEQAKATGREYFIVNSTPTCCQDCYEAYDGKTFHLPEDEDMIPPYHPNCYCEAVFFRSESVADEEADRTSQDLEF